MVLSITIALALNLYSASIVLKRMLNYYTYKPYHIGCNRREEVSTILVKNK